MARPLKCFISAAYETDLSTLKAVLAENRIEVFDMFDLSIGNSIQGILKQKLKEADFAIFVASESSKNVLYEMGVAEGLGKEALIIIDKKSPLPFYLDQTLSLAVNLQDRRFLELAILGFLEEIKDKPQVGYNKTTTSTTTTTTTTTLPGYSGKIKGALANLLELISSLRPAGNDREIEDLVADLFNTLQIKYADNVRAKDTGIDFAIWSEVLSRVIGNPIIVEVKTGTIDANKFQRAHEQLLHYAEKSQAKAGLLLYLDRSGRRHISKPSINPLIVAYDLEDFIRDILQSSFETVLLSSRNKTAHR